MASIYKYLSSSAKTYLSKRPSISTASKSLPMSSMKNVTKVIYGGSGSSSARNSTTSGTSTYSNTVLAQQKQETERQVQVKAEAQRQGAVSRALSSARSLYRGLDYAYVGMLPMSISFEEAIKGRLDTTNRLWDYFQKTRTEMTKSSSEGKVERAKTSSEADIVSDLYREGFLEGLGIGKSQEEAAFQEMLRTKAFYEQAIPTISYTIPQAEEFALKYPQYESVALGSIPEVETTRGSDWTKIALIGGAVLVGIYLIKKR